MDCRSGATGFSIMQCPMIQKLYTLFVLILLASFLACTASLPRTTLPDTTSPDLPGTLSNRIFSSPEDDLFREGLSSLKTEGQRQAYDKARSAFENLLRSYPKSKWSEPARRFIALLDELESCQQQGSDTCNQMATLEREKAEAFLENASLRKTLKLTQERLQTETQENEALKEDLQRLKNLEIQLEKRERMLR